jgi:3-hydroxyisobutyrate dehydrogenase
MNKIGFIGLGNMGFFMSKNLAENGFLVDGFDLSENALEKMKQTNVNISKNLEEVCKNKNVIITMLPDGSSVKSVWNEAIKFINNDTIMLDCSTIDINVAQDLHKICKNKNIESIDAPVSGGTIGAENGTLTFIVGGSKKIYEKVTPLFDIMGQKSILCGEGGSGQATKLCNNLLLAITMSGLGEALKLANSFNLNLEKFFEVISTSTGSCWALNNYFPVKNIGPTSPADNEFKPGFSSKLMLKDLDLAKKGAEENNLKLDLNNYVINKYKKIIENNKGEYDFSVIVKD